MHRMIPAVVGLLAFAGIGWAQTTVPSYIVAPGASVNVTVTGAAGQHYAVIASTANSGFSYGGVALQVGADVVCRRTPVSSRRCRSTA